MIRWSAEIEELAELALRTFPDLTESELRLLCAATTGESANCRLLPDSPTAASLNDPDFADSWPSSREIRAALIRWLCTNRDAVTFVDARGLMVLGAKITGELDLSFTSIAFPVLLFRCRLIADANFQYANLNLLSLPGSVTRGIFADRLVARAVQLRNGFHAEGEVCLRGAEIAGDLDCGNGEFRNPGKESLNCDGLKVGGDVFLRNGFKSDGEVRLLGAQVGLLDCSGGQFLNPGRKALSCDELRSVGGVLFRDGFTAEGAVRLLGANIDGNLDCAGAQIRASSGEAFNCDVIRVARSIFLRSDFSAEGEVRFVGAQIGGDLTIKNCTLSAKTTINAQGATVTGELFWRDLGNAGGQIEATLDLNHAIVGPIGDDEMSWPKAGNLILDGFVYTRFAMGPTDATRRLGWIDRQPQGRFLPQPFLQLAKVLRESGDNAGAREVLTQMEDSRLEHGNLGRMSRIWQWIKWCGIGYGYKPWRALNLGLGIVAVSAIFFWLGYRAGAVTPTDRTAFQIFETQSMGDQNSNSLAYYPRFYSLIFSLDTFLPIINLGEKDHWRPNSNMGAWGQILQFWLWIEIALGWLLTTLFVAGLTAIIRSG
jgi:hypothetical protein